MTSPIIAQQLTDPALGGPRDRIVALIAYFDETKVLETGGLTKVAAANVVLALAMVRDALWPTQPPLPSASGVPAHRLDIELIVLRALFDARRLSTDQDEAAAAYTGMRALEKVATYLRDPK